MTKRREGALEHVRALRQSLDSLEAESDRIERLGRQLARAFRRGHRLLAVGTGGGAALADHLASELVGRAEQGRPPLPAAALMSGAISLTASLDGHGDGEAFARQVRAQGRPGDVLVAFSCGRASVNVLAATQSALRMGLRTVGLTGPLPDPLAALCCDVVVADATSPTTIEEVHQVAVHLLCGAIEAELAPGDVDAGAVPLAVTPPRPLAVMLPVPAELGLARPG